MVAPFSIFPNECRFVLRSRRTTRLRRRLIGYFCAFVVRYALKRANGEGISFTEDCLNDNVSNLCNSVHNCAKWTRVQRHVPPLSACADSERRDSISTQEDEKTAAVHPEIRCLSYLQVCVFAKGVGGTHSFVDWHWSNS